MQAARLKFCLLLSRAGSLVQINTTTLHCYEYVQCFDAVAELGGSESVLPAAKVRLQQISQVETFV